MAFSSKGIPGGIPFVFFGTRSDCLNEDQTEIKKCADQKQISAFVKFDFENYLSSVTSPRRILLSPLSKVTRHI